jgi:hypothetical protein
MKNGCSLVNSPDVWEIQPHDFSLRPAQLAFPRKALVRLVGVLDPVLKLAVFLGKPLCHDV